jgi:alpha-L-fucosidase
MRLTVRKGFFMSLTRRRLLSSIAGAAASIPFAGYSQSIAPGRASVDEPEITPGPMKGTRQSLRTYTVPEWFRDAKFGMWAHWGPQSAIEDGDWYARNMYIQGSDQYDYHCQRFGHPSKFGYKDTIPAWKAEDFDPDHLISLYKAAGAKYFFSMGCHHDNFDLWNSKHNPWNAAKMGPHKDIVGLWEKAARNQGLRFGVSEHLWISYKWFSVSHGSDVTGPYTGVPYDGADPVKASLYINSDQIWANPANGEGLEWNENGIPTWWRRHWFDRIQDVVNSYEPDMLYSDGPMPFEVYGTSAVANLYNVSARRNGGKVEAVYFSKRPEDAAVGTCVLDRERGVLADISPNPWQTDTCIGDWHYKLGMKYKTPKRIIDLLCDAVSRNGNLLLNFPLPASGMLDLEELAILADLTAWMKVNGEAIFGTRPWTISGEGPTTQSSAQITAAFNEKSRKDLTAEDIRFTRKGSTLYAISMGWPEYKLNIGSLATNTDLRVGKVQSVELLRGQRLRFEQTDKGLTIYLPQEAPAKHAVAFQIQGAIA